MNILRMFIAFHFINVVDGSFIDFKEKSIGGYYATFFFKKQLKKNSLILRLNILNLNNLLKTYLFIKIRSLK